MSNLRNTKEFREAVLAALGVTEDKDVENKENFKKAILDALGISYTTEDIKNFEKFRALLVSSADNLADNLIAENIKKDVEILGITGSYEGGGGNSDYSIAEVSITNNTINELLFSGPNIANYGSDNASLSGEVAMLDGFTKTFNMLLYKGRVNMLFVGDTLPAPITCTGDIAYDGYGNFIITGNGTITLGTAS